MFEAKKYDEITFDQYFQGELKWQDEVSSKPMTCHFSSRMHLKSIMTGFQMCEKEELHENKSTQNIF